MPSKRSREDNSPAATAGRNKKQRVEISDSEDELTRTRATKKGSGTPNIIRRPTVGTTVTGPIIRTPGTAGFSIKLGGPAQTSLKALAMAAATSGIAPAVIKPFSGVITAQNAAAAGRQRPSPAVVKVTPAPKIASAAPTTRTPASAPKSAAARSPAAIVKSVGGIGTRGGKGTPASVASAEDELATPSRTQTGKGRAASRQRKVEEEEEEEGSEEVVVTRGTKTRTAAAKKMENQAATQSTRSRRRAATQSEESESESESESEKEEEEPVPKRGRGKVAKEEEVVVKKTPSKPNPWSAPAPVSTSTSTRATPAHNYIQDPPSTPISEPPPLLSPRKRTASKILTVSEESVRFIQHHILSKLTGRAPIPLTGLDTESNKVNHLIEQTILHGESNSALLIGPHASGKSALVDHALQGMREKYAYGEEWMEVRLSGLVQTDDRVALREIARQLRVEMELDDDNGASLNFSDTLTSLLAVLSHPEELGLLDGDGDGDAEMPDANFETANERPPSEIHAPPTRTSTALIFILDHFDLFALHPRQTLLYNLFDIAQARKAPICVIGLTQRLDAVEGLEKRVKSRFSHRVVQVRAEQGREGFWGVCKRGLGVEVEREVCKVGGVEVGGEVVEYAEEWNEHLEDLYATDKAFRRFVHRIFATTKDPTTFYSACITALTTLSSTSPLPSASDLLSNTLESPDSKLHLVEGLSLVEMCMLISAARIDARDVELCNFNMCYEEYKTLASKSAIAASAGGGVVSSGGGVRLWSRDVAMEAWEKLATLDLIIPATTSTSTTTGGSGLSRECRMWRVEFGLGELGGVVEGMKGLPSVVRRWCRDV
ncbi:origin recognition complex subunit 4 [Saitoella coloradoensis]